MSNLILKEIIALKNQQEINFIKDEEGVFCTAKKSTQILSCTYMSKNVLPETFENESNSQCEVKFVQKLV